MSFRGTLCPCKFIFQGCSEPGDLTGTLLVLKEMRLRGPWVEHFCQCTFAEGTILPGGWTLHVKFQFLVLLCGQKLPEGRILETGTEFVQRSFHPFRQAQLSLNLTFNSLFSKHREFVAVFCLWLCHFNTSCNNSGCSALRDLVLFTVLFMAFI